MADAGLTKADTKKRLRRWVPAFLAAFRDSGNVRAACQRAQVSRTVAYQHRNECEEFAALWEEAEQDAVDILEAEASKRARKQSDTLLIFLLKAHRPKKYRDPVQRFAQTNEAGEDVTSAYTDDQLLNKAATIIAKREKDAC